MLTGVPVTLQGSLAVVDGETVELPARQRDVLEALAVEPGTLVARDALVQQVWGSAATAPHGLASTVARLRRRLGAAGRGIVSCRGQGYRLDPEPPVGQAREAPETGKRGHVSIVGAGPGDPGLITVRGLAALEAADVVVHDRLVHPDLLAGRVAVDVGKEPGHHPVPQEEINALVVGLARRGKRVVRLKGGDPFVFGRGAEEAQALASAGLDFDVVPAPTSALAALTYAGIPATDRRCGSSIAFVTGHCAAGRGVDWDRLADATDTLVVLMGLARLSEVVDRLLAGGRRPDCPAAVVSRGTLPDQRVVGAPLARIPEAVAETDLPGPALLVVGEVVRLAERIAWFGPERDQEMVTRMPGGGVPR
jgi:uroporphyrin-III C-methyltransferase